ncbi:MAG: dihydrolipoamide acetyltransferase family protein [Oscillospiraceae bacterium]
MAEKIIMPKQGLQMTEGLITNWLKKEGETVTAGEPLFEMETDKLTITIDAEISGTLLKILRQNGETVPITEVIAIVGNPGEDISALLAECDTASGTESLTADGPSEPRSEEKPSSASAARSPGERVFSTPRARTSAESKGVSVAAVAGSGPDGLVIERDVLSYRPIKASPLAKAAAEANGVKLSELTGTGSHGKIMRRDVPTARTASEQSAGGMAELEEIIPMRGIRKVTAEKMVESLRVHAQLTHEVAVDMTNAVKLREAFKKQDKKVSFNDIVMYAATKALLDYPILNSTVTDEGIVLKHYVNMGMAVDINNGLIVPVIKNADLMTLLELGQAAKELADKAKNGTLSPDDYHGGTFTVSNLGALGLHAFTAIINTPQSGILAIGAIEKTPVVIGDQIVIRPMMMLRLTYDHRVTDGAPAARFIGQVKTYLEEPYLML